MRANRVRGAMAALLAMASWGAGCHYAVNVNIVPPEAPLSETVVSGKGENRVLIIPVEGFISSSSSRGALGQSIPSMLESITAQLEAARKEKRIKAVVLRIDSPGGTVSACDSIYHELAGYKKETKVPIVAQQMTVAASGGYYLSTVADTIFAQPTTVTGSIGVIMLKVNAQGLAAKVGVADDTVKAGASKDLMSVFREMAPQERRIIQNILDAMHEKFINVVLESRRNVQDRETSFDGRVFIGQEALQRGLVDRIGYLPDAIDEAKKLAGLTEATVIRLVAGKGSVKNAYSSGTATPAGMGMELEQEIIRPFIPSAGGPQFMYYWGW